MSDLVQRPWQVDVMPSGPGSGPRIVAMATNVAAITVFIVVTLRLPEASVGPTMLGFVLVPYVLGLLILFAFRSKLLLWSSLVASAAGLLVCALLLIFLISAPDEPLVLVSLVFVFGCAPLGLNVYIGFGGLRVAPWRYAQL